MPLNVPCFSNSNTGWRLPTRLLLTLLLVVLSACSGDTAPPLSNTGIQTPSVDPQTISGSFSLDGADQRFELVEGANGISISVGISRTGGHQAPVTLSLSANAGDSDNLSHDFSNKVLGAAQNQSSLTLKLAIAMGPIRPQQRQLEIVATDGVVTESKRLTLSVVPVEAPDVYLLIGQSNMEGSSEASAKDAGPGGEDQPVSRILQLNVITNDFTAFGSGADLLDDEFNFGNPTYIKAEDPLHNTYAGSLSGKTGTRIGSGLSFAKAALASTTQDIILVPAAWSGTAFCDNDLGGLAWNPESTPSALLGGTKLFERALLRTNFVLENSNGVLRGILWHQGESDARAGCAELYQDNLISLVSELRQSIRTDARGLAARGENAPVPFVLGTMSRGSDSRGDYSVFEASKQTIDTVHRTIESVIPFSAVSNHDDLVPPAYPCGQDSCIHFGSSAYREMGQRYYDALEDILAR